MALTTDACGTSNLANVDPRCAQLDSMKGAARPLRTDLVMSNDFAFGAYP
ncbi:MAG: hypothetical protein ABIW76_16330 [Fibrobacteria bacterium]